MGNQAQKYKVASDDSPPPRPHKPLHLQRPRIDTLPINPNDERAFVLPLGDPVLRYGSSPSEVTHGSGIYETVDTTDIQSESMPISVLVEEYGSQFPLRFSVSESLYGVCEESSLMEGQLLNILFEKETKVVQVRANTGAEYIVPLNSSLLFSILYNPQNKFETAKKGYLFPRVSDIMNASNVPQAVAVTKAFQCHCNGEILLVLEGQILIINSVQHEDDSRKLMCTITKRNVNLLLDEDVIGNFTTTASMLKVHISEFIELVSLPVSVILQNSGNKQIQLPLHATVGSYTIVDQRIEKSVILSSKCGHKNELIEVLLSVPIEVNLVKTSEHQLQLLRKESQTVYNSFHPSKLSKVVIDSNSSMNYIQSMLFKVVPEDGTWTFGIKMFPPQPPSTSSPVSVYNDIDDDYIDMSIEEVLRPSNNRPFLLAPSQNIPSSRSLSAPHTPIQALKTNPSNVPSSSVAIGKEDSCLRRPPIPIPRSISSEELTPSDVSVDVSRTLPRQWHGPDPVPYMIVRESGKGSLIHETPYDYVRLSHEHEQKLTTVETTNSQLASHINEMRKGNYIILLRCHNICFIQNIKLYLLPLQQVFMISMSQKATERSFLHIAVKR